MLDLKSVPAKTYYSKPFGAAVVILVNLNGRDIPIKAVTAPGRRGTIHDTRRMDWRVNHAEAENLSYSILVDLYGLENLDEPKAYYEQLAGYLMCFDGPGFSITAKQIVGWIEDLEKSYPGYAIASSANDV